MKGEGLFGVGGGDMTAVDQQPFSVPFDRPVVAAVVTVVDTTLGV
jgi:hypothetical protein